MGKAPSTETKPSLCEVADRRQYSWGSRPTEARGKAAYRGKRRSREAVVGGQLTGCESGGMDLETPAKDEPTEVLSA